MPQPDATSVTTRTANRIVVTVRPLVKTSPVGGIWRSNAEATVAVHEGYIKVLETDRFSILEGVVDEVDAVGHSELDSLLAAAYGAVRKAVVLLSPLVGHPRIVRPLVRVHVASEKGENYREPRTILSYVEQGATQSGNAEVGKFERYYGRVTLDYRANL